MSNQVVSPFIEDIKEIDSKINYNPDIYNVRDEALYASFMPYYVDPDDMGLTIILKREIQPGAEQRTGRKMGLSVLNVELPTDKPLTIEEAFEKLDSGLVIQNATPFGSVMTDPVKSNYAVEMVLVQVEPPEFLDEKRKIIKQDPGNYEVGAIPFDAMLGAIHDNFLQDMTTRMMLSELYIMVIEEAQQQAQGQNPADFSQAAQSGSNQGVIGGGANHTQDFYDNADDPENSGLSKTSNIDDDLLKQNQQKDFGAIYSSK